MYQSPVAGAAIVTPSAFPVVTELPSETVRVGTEPRRTYSVTSPVPPLVLTLSASAAAVRVSL